MYVPNLIDLQGRMRGYNIYYPRLKMKKLNCWRVLGHKVAESSQ